MLYKISCNQRLVQSERNESKRDERCYCGVAIWGMAIQFTSKPRWWPVRKLRTYVIIRWAGLARPGSHQQSPLLKYRGICPQLELAFQLPQRYTTTVSSPPHPSIHSITMSKRIVQLGGITVVGAGAYYLYNAGGDPKLAQKKIERTSSIVVSSPGRSTDGCR